MSCLKQCLEYKRDPDEFIKCLEVTLKQIKFSGVFSVSLTKAVPYTVKAVIDEGTYVLLVNKQKIKYIDSEELYKVLMRELYKIFFIDVKGLNSVNSVINFIVRDLGISIFTFSQVDNIVSKKFPKFNTPAKKMLISVLIFSVFNILYDMSFGKLLDKTNKSLIYKLYFKKIGCTREDVYFLKESVMLDESFLTKAKVTLISKLKFLDKYFCNVFIWLAKVFFKIFGTQNPLAEKLYKYLNLCIERTE